MTLVIHSDALFSYFHCFGCFIPLFFSFFRLVFVEQMDPSPLRGEAFVRKHRSLHQTLPALCVQAGFSPTPGSQTVNTATEKAAGTECPYRSEILYLGVCLLFWGSLFLVSVCWAANHCFLYSTVRGFTVRSLSSLSGVWSMWVCVCLPVCVSEKSIRKWTGADVSSCEFGEVCYSVC